MSMVYNYYAFGTSDRNAILYNLRDRLSENGWAIDYDQIDTTGRLAVHVPDTQCYFTIYKNANYANLSLGNCYPPFLITANTGVDSGTWFAPSYPGSEPRFHTYFVITNSFCFVNNKACVLILEGYQYYRPSYPFCFFYMFGQLNIPVEGETQGAFLFVVPFASSNERFGLLTTGFRLYYKNSVSSSAWLVGDDSFFYGLAYRWADYWFDCYLTYPVQYDYSYGAYTRLPSLHYQPYQFGRLYLRTLLVYARYTLDSVQYTHPIAETPFYLCEYRGIEWYNKTITYNTRKFKIFPLSGPGINYVHNYGVAFEVGNL